MAPLSVVRQVLEERDAALARLYSENQRLKLALLARSSSGTETGLPIH
jgi:hypothetical protein